MMNPPKIIAEIGCNHKGDMNIAKEMIITAAAYCKADYVKFQKRCNKELLSSEEYNAPHPHPENSYGATYGEHREFLEFTLEQHKQLQEWCKEFGIEYSTSVWDLTSAKEITTLQPKLIKIPSAINLNKPVLEYLFNIFCTKRNSRRVNSNSKMMSRKPDCFNSFCKCFTKPCNIKQTNIFKRNRITGCTEIDYKVFCTFFLLKELNNLLFLILCCHAE